MPGWLLPMLLLGASAGLSNFGGAIGLGLLPLARRARVEVVVAFVGMEVLAPVLGLVLGRSLAGGIGARADTFAGAILVAIGLYTIWETRKETRDVAGAVLHRRALLLLAVALSLDNLAIGFGLGLLDTPPVLAASFMGACSLVLTVIGLELGRRLGRVVGDRAELFSGLVLIGAGIFVIVHH